MENYKFVMWTLVTAGYEVYLVGGSVRDHLMGRNFSDMDMATNATPEQMQQVFADGTFRKIPTGIKHGTLTIEYGGDYFEITTFRRDVTTDGRNATVEYAATMQEDSQRRDFTVNSMYMDVHGTIYDPTGMGMEDIHSRTLRFVGDANQRCKEDYLRIFRLFRFQATLGFDIVEDALHAAYHNIKGVTRVSDERKWSEIKKMLEGKHLSKALHTMCQAQVPSNIFAPLKYRKIPSATIFPSYFRPWHQAYFAMFGAEMYPRMSKEEKAILLAYKASEKLNPTQIAYMMQKQGFDIEIFAVAYHWHSGCMDKSAIAGGVSRGKGAVFPLKSSDFAETGPALGKAMRDAETAFVQSLT